MVDCGIIFYTCYIGLEVFYQGCGTMTEYQVIVLIGSMFTLGVAIVTPILKLNTTITKLRDAIDSQTDSQKEYKKKNDESHEKLWEHEHDQDEKIHDHETRIRILEDVK